MRYGSIGSISHGTLRDADLLEAFADELEYLVQSNGKTGVENEAVVKLIWEARECDPDDVDGPAGDILTELCNALEEYAPPYCYFGAHEGDGSDFGFWPSMEEIQDLPVVENSDDAKALGEDCAAISDHGNVTVFGGDGSVLLELV